MTISAAKNVYDLSGRPLLVWIRPSTNGKNSPRSPKSTPRGRLGFALPPGFEAFARDFPRRAALSRTDSDFQISLHDAVVFAEFPRFGDGYVLTFFGDMNYGAPQQLTWGLYLVPGVAWHCVVVFEIADEGDGLVPRRPRADRLLSPVVPCVPLPLVAGTVVTSMRAIDRIRIHAPRTSSSTSHSDGSSANGKSAFTPRYWSPSSASRTW